MMNVVVEKKKKKEKEESSNKKIESLLATRCRARSLTMPTTNYFVCNDSTICVPAMIDVLMHSIEHKP